MTNIAIVTNLDERCGNADYARKLAYNLRYLYITRPNRVDYFADCLSVRERDEFPIVIVNWHPARVEVSTPLVRMLQSKGKKVILILQNSFDWEHNVEPDDLLCVCDAVVAHEQMRILCQGKPIENFHYIRHGIESGITNHDLLCPLRMVGTAGFPFPWKRTEVVARAAASIGWNAFIPAPAYPGFSWPINQWITEYRGLSKNPEANLCIDAGFIEEAELIRTLAKCAFNIFWFQSQDVSDQFGQTGSARLGIASGRPMIISDHRKFRSLLEDFPEYFYVAKTEQEVYDIAKQLKEEFLAGGCSRDTRPVSLLQSWEYATQRYLGVIDKLLCA